MTQFTEEEKTIRRVERRFSKGVVQYGLIEEGDKILIGLSGGKDSLALVELLGKRVRIYKPRFSVVAVHVVMKNIPYQSDTAYLKAHCEAYGVPFVQYETAFDPATDTRKSPCFLCSWNRRKALFTVAKEHGCNKIALGHHMDDILETLLMNVTYQGAFSTMPPRLVMKKFDMTIIRPMCLVHEADLVELAALHSYQKQVKNCPYESQSSRSDMKQEYTWFASLPLIGVIAFSWAIAFFEYSCQIPANRIGFIGNGGPFTLMQLKVIQEVITLVIFTVFTTVFFKGEALHWNHLAAFVCLIAAVYFVFMK